MSTRYEGCSAEFSSLTIARPLDEIGDDTLDKGRYALLINYDEVFYITGTVAELEGFASRVGAQVERIKAHATGPLTLGDIKRDEDGDYLCPRCDTYFEGGNYESFAELQTAITAHIAEHNAEVTEAQA